MQPLRQVPSILVTLCLLLSTSVRGQQVTKINVEELGRLPAFSHAAVVGGLVFVSGTLGTEVGSLGLVPGGVGPQTTQTLRNIERILEEAGSSLDRVAKCTVYLTEMDDFATMNEAYIAVFGDQPPARATLGVAELALDAAVEIECIAAKR